MSNEQAVSNATGDGISTHAQVRRVILCAGTGWPSNSNRSLIWIVTDFTGNYYGESPLFRRTHFCGRHTAIGRRAHGDP